MNKKHKERKNETSFKEYYYRVGWCSEFIPIIVEREVYTIASFSANIDSGLPPLEPGWERVIVWKRMDGFTLYSYANSTQGNFCFMGTQALMGHFCSGLRMMTSLTIFLKLGVMFFHLEGKIPSKYLVCMKSE